MITPKNKELSKLVLWEDRGNTVLYKIENNTLLFSDTLDQGGITFDIEDMQEVDFNLVGSEIDYKPILKKLGLNDEEVNQFIKKENKISIFVKCYVHTISPLCEYICLNLLLYSNFR